LHNVFKEFKSHEDIENEHIMKQLKLKLKAMEIYNSAVCNCHKDDEFTPLMKLVETGYLFINKSKTTSERINYGITLRKALNKFTNIFIPHMKEEEEIFQPLLLKYFSLGELSEMKNIVIKLHIQQRKRFVGTKLENNKNVLIKTTISAIEKPLHLSIAANNQQVNSINDFPNEIMLKIFANLSFRDKFKCSQVSRKWNCLIYDKLNWKELNFDDWKPGKVSLI
jgi:F-box/leucine-rich repeat protein 5